jgi:LysM repeat protein
MTRLRSTLTFVRRVLFASFALNVLLAALLIRGCVARQMARAILVDGKVVCLVASEKAANRVHDTLLAQKKGEYRGKAAFRQNWEDRPQSAKGEKVCSAEEAVKLLKPLLSVEVEAYAIQLDGKDLVVTPTKELAEEALRSVKARFLKEGETPLEPQKFEKEPAVTPVQVSPDVIVSDLRTATEELLKGTTEPTEYVVKVGDTPSKVAGAHNMTVAQLYRLNPGLERAASRDDIQPGDKWIVAGPRPKLAVITKKETVRTVETPPRVITEERDTLPVGELRVVRAGSKGERKEWVRAAWRNDEMVAGSEKIIKTETIREPEDKVVMKGVRPAVPEPAVPSR